MGGFSDQRVGPLGIVVFLTISGMLPIVALTTGDGESSVVTVDNIPGGCFFGLVLPGHILYD